MLGTPTHSVVVAAAIALAITSVQLWSRFRQRRPFSTLKSTGLFAAIARLSAVAAGLLASTAPSRLGMLGIGASYPFWAPKPGSLTDDGDDAADRPGKLFAQLVSSIWTVTGALGERLDGHLATVKNNRCQQLIKQVDARYQGRDPAYDHIKGWLEQWIIEFTDRDLRERRQIELAQAYELAKESPEPLLVMFKLAYDWKAEREARDICVSKPPSKRRPH